MAESSGFFNAELVNGQYDREYLAEAFAKYFSLFIANGVFPNPSDGLQVFKNTTADMNVLMHPGYAWIDGYWYKLDGNLTLAIDPADGVLNRIDSIMVRWDLEKRSIYAQVVKGTPASEPTAPEVIRSADFYDLCVSHIRVDAGTTKIMQSMITDTRMDSSLCGIVTGVVQSIDTTTLFEQYQAALKEFQDTRMVEFDEWQEQEKSDFDNWFETIKGTLDGDTAGNLLNLITQETADRKAADLAIESKLGINATATYEESTVKITAPEGLVVVTFLAPSNCNVSDKYTINGDELTLTDLNGEPVEDAWKQGSPITFTISGTKAFFKAGGGSKIPNDLPPLLPNFALDFSGTTVTVTANKLPLSDKTSMLAGGVWVLASTVPDSPKGTIVQQWTAADLIDSTQDTESTEVVTWTYPNWSAGEPIYCRQYTYNEKGQYQTMLQGAVASTEDEPIPSYSEVLSENTWAQIAEAVANNDPIVDSWQIGDTKDEVVAGETLTFVIVGKDHDDKSDGTGKAKLTFGMTQLMNNTRQMNGSNTNAGSFAGSALYAHLWDTILPGMPEELRAAIKPVNKPTSSGSQNSTIRNDSMSLWLFSEVEIFGRTTYSFGGEGFQYPYFATAANRIKRLFNGMGEVSIWWERSPNSDSSLYFCCVYPSGTASVYDASTSHGVCFGFCI